MNQVKVLNAFLLSSVNALFTEEFVYAKKQ